MLAHRHFRLAFLVVLVLAGLSAAEVPGDNANDSSDLPTFHSNVSEVRVTFFATGENNRALETLTKSDFAIVDNERVVRDFRSFTHSDETALDVVALVDMSESVAPRIRAAMNDVLQLAAHEQSIADDHISVLSFGGMVPAASGERASGGALARIQPAVLCSSGCGDVDSANRLRSVRSGGATPLYDALIFGADFLSHHRRPGSRRAVILFSDGADTISLHSSRDALQAVLDEGALVYTVDMGTSSTAGSTFLWHLSEATGGRYFSLRSQQNGAVTVSNAVLEDLRASYVVTYDLPSHEAGFHSLRLLPTHNLNVTFHSRNGYLYEPSGH